MTKKSIGLSGGKLPFFWGGGVYPKNRSTKVTEHLAMDGLSISASQSTAQDPERRGGRKQ